MSNLTKLIQPKDPHEIYNLCKAIDGLEAEGSFILAAARVTKYYWPSGGSFYYTLLESLDELNYANFLNTCLEENAVDKAKSLFLTLDFECFKSIYDTELDGVIPIPSHNLNDASLGRHAVAIVDVNEKGLWFANSWGSKWGKNGFGFLSTHYLQLHTKEILLLTDAAFGLNLEKMQKNPKAQTSSLHMARVWQEKNFTHVQSIEWKGEKLKLVTYSTLTMSGEVVIIFDLLTAEDQRVAWAHLRETLDFAKGAKESFIEDLFVWPMFRRKGYGTLLEKHYCYYSKKGGSEKIVVPFFEMDDLKGVSSPVRLFTLHHGYSHIFKNSVLPCRTGFAEKSI